MTANQYVHKLRLLIRLDYDVELTPKAEELARLRFLNGFSLESSAREIGKALQKDKEAGI